MPALPPGTVNGGDSGGVSLRCFGGVETMKIFLFPSFNRFANYTQNMTYNIQSHQHHYKLLRYVYFCQISTVKTVAVMLFWQDILNLIDSHKWRYSIRDIRFQLNVYVRKYVLFLNFNKPRKVLLDKHTTLRTLRLPKTTEVFSYLVMEKRCFKGRFLYFHSYGTYGQE